ncbi:MAG: non-homologous end-joining DNA ligase [Alicyclobacillaceae bacterium]|nr:non-homologous end-joining DNA ligase [Alicyclobacillaceae bacterium]
MRVVFRNVDKVLWPPDVTKGELLQYLEVIGPVMLPYLAGRPLTVIRYPNGVHEDGFYQKHPPPDTPVWVTRTPVAASGEMIVADSLETLLWLGQLAAIEYHVPFSRVSDMNRPTHLVFDLDPSVDNFSLVCKVALLIRDVLNRLGLPAYPKTSGATGIQIYVPVSGGVTFDETRPFMKMIAEYCEALRPDWVTTARRKRDRGHKVYIDYLQHAPNKTLIAPYSPRATPLATVSAPMRWEEVEGAVSPHTWNLRTMMDRLRREGDLFAPVLEAGVDIRPLVESVELLQGKRSS